MKTEEPCTNPNCRMPASVLIHGVPFCTADGRAANGGRL